VSIAISRRAAGRHRADDRIATLEARLAQAEADNAGLVAANETFICDLTQAVLRGCRDEMRIATAEAENALLKQRVRELSNKVIRAGAEHQRLRQAVVNARPRITEVPCAMVRPYSPVVQLPYASPVPYRDTSCEETQKLPILDQPHLWPAYQAP
jgi:hypothetical protein